MKNAENEERDADAAAQRWPAASELLSRLESLRTLKAEKDNRDKKAKLAGLISKVTELCEKAKKLRSEIGQYPDIATDYDRAEADERRRREIFGALTSAKLRATLAMEDGYKAIVKLADGTVKEVETSDEIDADGYVQVSIPGVATIRVAPQDLDVDALEAEREEEKSGLQTVFEKYRVSSLAELEDLRQTVQLKQLEAENCEKDVKRFLDGRALDDYISEMRAIVTDETLKIPDGLDDEIVSILEKVENRSLDEAFGAAKNTVEDYERRYGSMDDLGEKREELSSRIRSWQSKLQKYGDVPLLTEEDYDDEIDRIDNEIKQTDKDILTAQDEIGKLSVEEDVDIAGLESDVADKKALLEQEKEKLALYLRIQKDFKFLQEAAPNRFDQFYRKFNEYLEMITGRRIILNTGADGLDLQSGGKDIHSKELLSEGTKKIVLLAFRLAVLEYFFPEGGGFVVLDDAIIDMDPERRAQSASLLKRFAEKNQVIFTTCDPTIASLLGGNLIHL